MAILAVNAGSSTLKFSLHPRHGAQALSSVLSGTIQGLEPAGLPQMQWSFNGLSHRQNLPQGADGSFARALATLRTLLVSEPGIPAIEAVAHRVVHGGADFSASVIVNTSLLARLAQLSALAPLHQPHNLEGVRAFGQAFPELPQIACFDTAFHATLAEVDYAFALPQALSEQGVRRYGFHGLSYQYIMDTLLEHSPRARSRVLMAHLGNGASLCAARDGKSFATTMGFSTLDGLMMGTRCGNLDPGVLLYLLEQGWDRQRLQALLYQQSGLLGVSGISADMRRLRADGSVAARKAVALFTHSVVRESGALTACMGGLDVLVFSGGIGEHDAQLRTDVCAALGYLGVRMDPHLNAQALGHTVVTVHTPHSAVEVWVVPTDEGLVAARDAARLIAQSYM